MEDGPNTTDNIDLSIPIAPPSPPIPNGYIEPNTTWNRDLILYALEAEHDTEEVKEFLLAEFNKKTALQQEVILRKRFLKFTNNVFTLRNEKGRRRRLTHDDDLIELTDETYTQYLNEKLEARLNEELSLTTEDYAQIIHSIDDFEIEDTPRALVTSAEQLNPDNIIMYDIEFVIQFNGAPRHIYHNDFIEAKLSLSDDELKQMAKDDINNSNEWWSKYIDTYESDYDDNQNIMIYRGRAIPVNKYAAVGDDMSRMLAINEAISRPLRAIETRLKLGYIGTDADKYLFNPTDLGEGMCVIKHLQATHPKKYNKKNIYEVYERYTVEEIYQLCAINYSNIEHCKMIPLPSIHFQINTNPKLGDPLTIWHMVAFAITTDTNMYICDITLTIIRHIKQVGTRMGKVTDYIVVYGNHIYPIKNTNQQHRISHGSFKDTSSKSNSKMNGTDKALLGMDNIIMKDGLTVVEQYNYITKKYNKISGILADIDVHNEKVDILLHKQEKKTITGEEALWMLTNTHKSRPTDTNKKLKSEEKFTIIIKQPNLNQLHEYMIRHERTLYTSNHPIQPKTSSTGISEFYYAPLPHFHIRIKAFATYDDSLKLATHLAGHIVTSKVKPFSKQVQEGLFNHLSNKYKLHSNYIDEMSCVGNHISHDNINEADEEVGDLTCDMKLAYTNAILSGISDFPIFDIGDDLIPIEHGVAIKELISYKDKGAPDNRGLSYMIETKDTSLLRGNHMGYTPEIVVRAISKGIAFKIVGIRRASRVINGRQLSIDIQEYIDKLKLPYDLFKEYVNVFNGLLGTVSNTTQYMAFSQNTQDLQILQIRNNWEAAKCIIHEQVSDPEWKGPPVHRLIYLKRQFINKNYVSMHHVMKCNAALLFDDMRTFLEKGGLINIITVATDEFTIRPPEELKITALELDSRIKSSSVSKEELERDKDMEELRSFCIDNSIVDKLYTVSSVNTILPIQTINAIKARILKSIPDNSSICQCDGECTLPMTDRFRKDFRKEPNKKCLYRIGIKGSERSILKKKVEPRTSIKEVADWNQTLELLKPLKFTPISPDNIITHLETGKNLAIIGPGGVGKTHRVNNIVKPWCKENNILVVPIAPTNVAAAGIGGQTCHKFLGLQMKENGTKIDNLDQRIEKLLRNENMRTTDASVPYNAIMIILEEMSMAGASVFIKLAALKRRWGAQIQFVFIGDFNQLPVINMDDVHNPIANTPKDFIDTRIFYNLCDGYLCEIYEMSANARQDKDTFTICNTYMTRPSQYFPQENRTSRASEHPFINLIIEHSITHEKLIRANIHHYICRTNKRRQDRNAFIAYKMAPPGSPICNFIIYDKTSDKPAHLMNTRAPRQQFPLYPGLPIIFIRSTMGRMHPNRDLINNEIYIVLSFTDITSTSITIQPESGGMAINISEQDLTHFDVAYAVTVHKAQGKTYSYPYIIEEYNKYDQKMKYTALTRCKSIREIYIYK